MFSTLLKTLPKVSQLFKTCLDTLLLHEDVAIIEVGAHETINNNEAKENTLVDHFTTQAALTNVVTLCKVLKHKKLL